MEDSQKSEPIMIKTPIVSRDIQVVEETNELEVSTERFGTPDSFGTTDSEAPSLSSPALLLPQKSPKRERYRLNVDAKKRGTHGHYNRRSSIGPISPTTFDGFDTSNIKKSKSQGDIVSALQKEDKEKSPGIGFGSWMKQYLFGMFKSSKDFKTEESQKKVFGTPLTSLDLENNVPIFVIRSIQFLEEESAIRTSGLYRASGNKTVIDEVKKKIDQGSSKNTRFKCLKEQDVNTVTGILKQFFRELPEPLVSEEVIQECVQFLALENPVDRLHEKIQELPEPSLSTLRYLIRHLARVSQFQSDNKMNSMNLSIVWGPCVFKCANTEEAILNGSIERVNQVLKVLIVNYEAIFERKPTS